MKFSSSYTDLNGLTVSLDVSASASYPEPLCEALSQPFAVADLASSAFEQAIPELSTQLVQAHSAAALALDKSYTEALRQEVDSTAKTSEPANSLTGIKKVFGPDHSSEPGVPLEIVKGLYEAARQFQEFIARHPDSDPFLWFADKNKKVVDLPHYQMACAGLARFELHLYSKTIDTL